jgi:hypothetical protein
VKRREAVMGTLSLFALGAGVLVGVTSTIGFASESEEMASLFGVIAGIGIGLLACIPSLIFAVIGILRKEKPMWPSILGFVLSALPGGLGLWMLGKMLANSFRHLLKI